MNPGERYLALALRIGRLAPGLVDSYTGPPGIAAEVEAEAPRAADELAAETRELRAHAEREDDPARRRWLTAQLAAFETVCAALGGERISYRALVERCYGVPARIDSEDAFAAAHADLDGALPGPGTVAHRYQAWLASQTVPVALLPAAIEALAGELRARTRAAFDLPAGERVDFELATDRPWAGFADPVDAQRTRVALNTDLPIPAFRLLDLVAHEAYPGHHTEHVCKQAGLVRGRGRVELAVFAYPTPQALLAEGLAMIGLEQLVGDEADAIAAGLLRPLGVPYDDATAGAVRTAEIALGRVRTNIAIALDEGRASLDDARAYMRRWALRSDEQIEKSIGSLSAAAFPASISCYPEGRSACLAFARREPDALRRLLTEQLTTADLL